MAEAEWYYTKNGQRIGPVAAADLKQLAGAGTLLRGDFVWEEGMAEWVPANKINGLFAVPPPTPSHAATIPVAVAIPIAPDRVNNAAPKKSLYDLVQIALAFLSLLFCFPIGLFYLWRKLNWTTRTKWIWTGVWAGCVMILVLSSDNSHEPHKVVSSPTKAKPVPATSKTADGRKQYSVSSGWSSVVIELTPEVSEELSLRDFEKGWSGQLTFKMTYDKWTGYGRGGSPWKYSAYDSQGVKLDSGVVQFPDSISVGQTVVGRISLTPDAWSKASKIVIEHR